MMVMPTRRPSFEKLKWFQPARLQQIPKLGVAAAEPNSLEKMPSLTHQYGIIGMHIHKDLLKQGLLV